MVSRCTFDIGNSAVSDFGQVAQQRDGESEFGTEQILGTQPKGLGKSLANGAFNFDYFRRRIE